LHWSLLLLPHVESTSESGTLPHVWGPGGHFSQFHCCHSRPVTCLSCFLIIHFSVHNYDGEKSNLCVCFGVILNRDHSARLNSTDQQWRSHRGCPDTQKIQVGVSDTDTPKK